MKYFKITYKKISKYNNEIERTIIVKVSKTTDDISIDAKAAVEIFIASVGNLKKYDIIEIQEVAEDGAKIGEPITPQGDSTIIPYRKSVKEGEDVCINGCNFR